MEYRSTSHWLSCYRRLHQRMRGRGCDGWRMKKGRKKRRRDRGKERGSE